MPTNVELSIILRLRDQASKAMREAGRELQGFQERIKSAGLELRQLSRNLLQAGAVVTGAFALAFRTAGQYIPAVRDAVNGLQTQFVLFQNTVAQAALPVLQQLAFVLQSAREAFERLDPATRDAIVRWTFLAGIGAVLLGTVGKLASAVLLMGAAVLKAGAALAIAHPWLLLLSVAAIGFITALQQWPQVFSFVTRLIDRLVLSFQALIKAIKAAWAILSGGDAKKAIQELSDFIQKNNEAFQRGGGPVESFAKNAQRFIDDYVHAGRRMVDETRQFLEQLRVQWEQFWTSFTDVGRRSSEILSGGVTELETRLTSVYRTMIVEGGKAKDFFANFGRAILETIATMIARFLALITVVTILKAVLGIVTRNPVAAAPVPSGAGLQVVHRGGRIPRFQQGGEVPALLESGEFVVRRAVAQRHAGTLEQLNRTGELEGGGQPIVNQFFIQATDAASFRTQMQANADLIEGMFQRAIRRGNNAMRQAVSLA